MTNAVINTNSESKIERREAFQTYGPPPVQPQPQQQTIILNPPSPVYGAPAVQKFPQPPTPAKEYGMCMNMTYLFLMKNGENTL